MAWIILNSLDLFRAVRVCINLTGSPSFTALRNRRDEGSSRFSLFLSGSDQATKCD
jgi:hypothetical protein